MTTRHLTTIGASLLMGFSVIIAQETTPEQPEEDNSIKGQFETLTRKSTNYNQNGKRYEVVRLVTLNALQKNVLDSVSTANGVIVSLRANIAENETALQSLRTKLDETTSNLEELTKEKDSMPFFGSMVTKSTYKVVVWSIIIGLLLLVAVLLYKFKRNNTLTQQAKGALQNLEEEYEQHRRKALEREQKISRKLQDEINKNKKSP